MKKILSWVITITLLLSLTPALPVSADGEAYAVLGVQNGDRIILNPKIDGYTDFQHKVTIVNADQVTNLTSATELTSSNFTLEPQATGIDSVEFAIDGETVSTDTEAPFELVLNGNHEGEHTLTATINKTGGGTEVKIIAYTGIVGDIHDSRNLNYNSGILDASNTPTFNGNKTTGRTIEDGALKIGGDTTVNSAWLQPGAGDNKLLKLGDAKLLYVDYDLYKTHEDLKVNFRTSKDESRGTIAGATGYVSSAMPTREWVHITVVTDCVNGKISAYMNGVQFRSCALTSSPTTTATDNISPYLSFGADRFLSIDNYTVRTYKSVTAANITSSSIEDGATGVSERISSIRLTAERIIGETAKEDVTIEEINPETGAVVNTFTTYTVSASDAEFIIYPQGLETEKTYKVTADKVKDYYGKKFNSYEFTFTTRGADENLKPEATVSAEKSRYDSGETITLTAVATDELATSNVNGGIGAIEWVEFLADGEVIEGSRMTESTGDNIYTFDWNNVPERLEAYSITARACDNNGDATTSEPILVQVFSPKAPEINLTVPETIDGKNLGVSSGKIFVSASATDIDGVITSAELTLLDPNGEPIETKVFHNDFESISYTFEDDFDLQGNYTVQFTATDDNSSYKDDDLSTFMEKRVYVAHKGKAYPAIFTDDLTDPANKAKWSLTGEAERAVDENGVTFTQQTSGTATASRKTSQPISGKILVGEVAVKFSDASHERIVSFVGVTVADVASFTNSVTFNANGKILVGSTEKGSYKKDTEYKVTALLDQVSGKTVIFLNGEKLGEIATTTASDLSLTMSVSQKATSQETVSFSILEYGVYKLGNTLDPSTLTITLKDKDVPSQTGISFTGISQYPEYIEVSANGIDEASIKKGVFLVGPDGKYCATYFENGKFYINEKLVAGATYILRLTSDIRVGNVGLGGTVDYPITTQAKANGIDVEVTGFEQISLTPDTSSVNFETEVSGTATVVCAVYVGNIMKEIIYQDCQDETVNLSVNLNTIFGGSVPENAYIEAFVLGDLTDMAPVSDMIYRLD